MVWKCMAIDTDGEVCARCITTPGRQRPKDEYCPMGHRGTWATVSDPTTECRST
jgi:hypothetical protein